MENILKVLMWVVFVLPMTHCSEDHQNISIEELEVKLVTLDEDGNEKTVFEAGTNVVFALKLTNNSGQEIEWSFCQLLQQEDFYLVYKWIEDDNGNKELVPIGKPYPTPVNCPDINLPSKIPAGMNDFTAKISWDNNPDNLPLTPGKYYTSFQYTFQTESGAKEVDLKVEFEVQ